MLYYCTIKYFLTSKHVILCLKPKVVTGYDLAQSCGLKRRKVWNRRLVRPIRN